MNFADRVMESITTAPGTGPVTLTGANSTDYVTFASVYPTATQIDYKIDDGAGNWEVGIGVISASGTNLTRENVLSTSLGTTALINFSTTAAKTVAVVLPSALIIDQGAAYAMRLGLIGIGS